MTDQENWHSAGLEKGNPFTVAFLLEAVTVLQKGVEKAPSDETIVEGIAEAERILSDALLSPDADPIGAACLKSYPPTSYLTQLVVRALRDRDKLTPELRAVTRKWAWHQIDHELALSYSNSQTADAFALAYAVMLVSLCSQPFEATPEQNQILRKAVDVVFGAQLPDGSWPRSRPLFHYPKVGNAYCFEYEMLTQLLQQRSLMEHILRHLPELTKATMRLRDTAFHFPAGSFGWASGHHPQLQGPESWSTAAVYHFLHQLDRVLAEAVRRSVFQYIGAEYTPRQEGRCLERPFAVHFLDGSINVDGTEKSLRSTLEQCLVMPVAEHAAEVERGRSLPAKVPISAILFGPPGTAKTRLAKEIADYLGWPLLTIDPSHLVRNGLDQVQAETNRVFSMLAALERIVVLLDEFDEMVRERTALQSEMTSRLLTTAMLPKLAMINDRRRIVFIVATNHIDQFDFAIRRPGRFDILLQVMPPNTDSKLAHPTWEGVFSGLQENYGVRIEKGGESYQQLSKLTYAEFDQLAEQLHTAEDAHHVAMMIGTAHDHCTLMQRIKGEQDRTWAEICIEQESYVRIPR